MGGPSEFGSPAPEDDNGDSLRPNLAPVPGVGGGTRKKAAGVRQWMLLDSAGQAQVLEAGKHAIMKQTGLPGRDLRILDPVLSYPSSILGRERAIVINLEHIKAIIKAQEVFLLNSRDPCVGPFIKELQQRIWRHHHHHATKSQDEEAKADGRQQSAETGDGPISKLLPFEFVALEACLEAACSGLDNEARTLELEAYPALDKLTTQISTLNLERVRQIKSRLVAITGRVQKVRDELEHLLDDHEDMAEMHLTEKLLQQQLENSSVSSVNEQDGLDDEATNPDMDVRQFISYADITVGDNEGFSGNDAGLRNIHNPQELLHGDLQKLSKDGSSATQSTINEQVDVLELEMLLEAYFVQIDGTLNKLSTLREYVDDTEDYINIMLDDKQNHLLQMGVTLTTATLVVTAFVVVAGIFGMNIQIGLFDDTSASTKNFLWIVGGCSVSCIILFTIAISWYKYKGLLQ